MKRLMKAFLWTLCYGGVGWIGIRSKLGFNILEKSNWIMLFDKSAHAHWSAEMAPKKLVCKILLAFIIIGILGLAVVTKKKKTRVTVVKGELPQTSSFRPAPMASQGRIAPPAPSMPIQAPSANSSITQSAPSVPSINLLADAIRQATDIANSFEVSIFPHVKLENTFTQLVVSDDSTALLLKILPQSGTWKVEPASIPEESLWTLEGEQPKTILKDIIESTATLARLEPEARPVAVVLVAADIENTTVVRTYLEQNGIRIASLNHIEGIPSWQELLTEFYPPKKREEQNETEKVI